MISMHDVILFSSKANYFFIVGIREGVFATGWANLMGLFGDAIDETLLVIWLACTVMGRFNCDCFWGVAFILEGFGDGILEVLLRVEE
jgi:hypothetical protein